MRGTACVMPLSPSDVFPPLSSWLGTSYPLGFSLGDILFLILSLYYHETNNLNNRWTCNVVGY